MLRLTMERLRRGWTKTELSRRARIQLSDVSRIESGRMKPYQPQRQRLAQVLEVPADRLFEEVEADGSKG